MSLLRETKRMAAQDACHAYPEPGREEAAGGSGPAVGGKPECRIICDPLALSRLAPAWSPLSARSGNPMLGYAWAAACAETFTTGRQLHVVVQQTPEGLRAVAPLVSRQDGIPRLELLGVDELYEPMDFLFEEPAALSPLIAMLARSRTPLVLKRVLAPSPLVARLQQTYRWDGLMLTRQARGAPWIPLDAGWIHPESRLGAGQRAALMRAKRIAERLGPVACEVHRPAPHELGPLLAEAFDVEAAGWKGRAGSALVLDAERGAFYRRYAALAAAQGMLRVCFLRIAGRAAAMQLAVESGRRWWLLKIGFDEAFKKCSPGSLLMLETIRHAAGEGLQGYEFLGTDEPWTRLWTPFVHSCISLLVYPAGATGLAAFAADAAATARRRLDHFLEARHAP